MRIYNDTYIQFSITETNIKKDLVVAVLAIFYKYLQNLKYKGICKFSFDFGWFRFWYFLSILILSVKNRGCGGIAVGERGRGVRLMDKIHYISLTKVVCRQSLNRLSIEEAGSYTLILSNEHKNTLREKIRISS